ncbi:hypothetical protein AALP_AA8G438200 [Arabis alpina]|uniref:FBD domain-containing protein n=1 Tax=Arabis alpina TaxID=50452 RepID=A0A087GDA3_ARAAL|nr:hypothetical protein AALP_AA8G438200 [Arabis alpina]
MSEAKVEEEDMISALPEDLLVTILLLVPIKDAVATMVLSKRWRFIWMMLPRLEYKENGDGDDDFDDYYELDNSKCNDDDDDDDERNKSIWLFFDKSMELHKAPLLRILHIKLGPRCPSDVDVGKWVAKAVYRGVVVLKIKLCWSAGPARLPKSLYNCKTLVQLVLSHKILVDFPSSSCLPSLIILDLLFVVYKDEASLVRLLSSCPVLADLGVKRMKDDNAYIDVKSFPDTDKFTTSLSAVSSLQLGLTDEVLVRCSTINFSRLIKLTIYPDRSDWLEPFLLLLENAPKLKDLLVDDEYVIIRPKILPLSWKQPSSVPGCLSSQLEIFEWRAYGRREVEEELLTYILANSMCLKTATISLKPTFGLEEQELIKKVLRASSRPLHVCIVGSGPAGFYTADKLLKTHEGARARVDIIDRLPTPFGLVRSGVAPDHPETKIAINQFSRVAQLKRCSFYGNVKLGSDLSLSELRDLYDVVVLAYGAESDKELGIPGERLSGIHSAREFVWWYNGHPDYSSLKPDLKRVILEFEDISCSMVLKAIGYKSVPINDLPFDHKKGIVPNVRGRVVSQTSGGIPQTEPGLYVCGWLKRGPVGIIATNLYCAEETVASISEDIEEGACESAKAGSKGLLQLLEERNVKKVDFSEWEKIDAKEKQMGSESNKPREKLVTWEDLLGEATN